MSITCYFASLNAENNTSIFYYLTKSGNFSTNEGHTSKFCIPKVMHTVLVAYMGPIDFQLVEGFLEFP